MSITNVSIKAKQVILLRLLKDGESLIDASSKSGLLEIPCQSDKIISRIDNGRENKL